MFTPARAAISRVDAPVKPRAAKTSSAAERMRALVDPGASRAFSSAVLLTTADCLERSTTRRQAPGNNRRRARAPEQTSSKRSDPSVYLRRPIRPRLPPPVQPQPLLGEPPHHVLAPR